MKKIVKSILKYVSIYMIVIAIFITALILSSLFPRDWIQQNAEESAIILFDEGNPNKILDMKFDNYTDALMINTAYSIDPQHPFESILLARKNYLPGTEQMIHQDANGELVSSIDGGFNILGELYKTVQKDIRESYEYARYWHGYLVFLRPALLFLNISQIKVIMGIMLAVLAFYLLLSLYKKIPTKFCYIILLGLAFSDFFLMGLTLQGVMTFFISIIASILICKRFDKIKSIGSYFMVIGMVTCFLDLLTHPIITLGIPMIVYLLLKQEKEEITLTEAIKIIIINSILWGIGYVITNLTKWILVDIFYQRNIINIALTQFLYRSQAVNSNTSGLVGEAIIRNFGKAGIRTILYLGVLLIYVVIYLIRNYKEIHFDIKKSLPYLIVSFMPIAWYVLMNNHDVEHDYFTYRGLVVFYIGIGIFLLKLIDKKNENKKSMVSTSTEKITKDNDMGFFW